MTNDEEVVVELIKEWFEKHDASLLAKENQIVFWENDAWVIWSMRETVNIFKSTIIPFGLMKVCDDGAVRVAALELNRSYISGVNSRTAVLPQYFNFHRDCVKLGTDYGNYKDEIVKHIIDLFERMGVNVKLTCIGKLANYAMNYLELPALSSQERNALIRKHIVGTQFKERNGNSRFLHDGKMHVVIRYGKASGLFELHEYRLEHLAIKVLESTHAAKKFAKGFKRDLLKVSLGQ